MPGERYGKLTIIGYSHTDEKKRKHFKCKCDCGNECVKLGYSIKNGGTKSCGCMRRDNMSNVGKTYSPLVVIPIGTVFGKLTVVGETFSKKSEGHCKVKCECGKEKVMRTRQLQGSEIKSCGCYSTNVQQPIKEKEIYKKYKQCRRSAERRNLQFELTREDYELMIHEPCTYCGNEIKYIDDTVLLNGVDRIDSTLGYVEGNCVPCCLKCNRAKNAMTKEEFITWVKKTYEHMVKMGWIT